MTTQPVHFLTKSGRIACQAHLPAEQFGAREATTWPERVTCQVGDCKSRAKADLIIADRQRVAWWQRGELRVGPFVAHSFEVVINDGACDVDVVIEVDGGGPRTVRSNELFSIDVFYQQVRELCMLIRGRYEHRQRYAVEGAPPDPDTCQHNAARPVVTDGVERIECWTCRGNWAADGEGIAEAARAAAGAS